MSSAVRKAFQASPTVMGEFENWNFNSERISYIGDRDKKNDGGEEEEQVVYIIDPDDYEYDAS